MSKRADRERAESGIIFRNGKLVSKEEWYKTHPTRQMRVAQQAKVDVAVKDELVKILPKKEVVVPNRYYCTSCRRYHTKKSKIGSEHVNFYLPEM